MSTAYLTKALQFEAEIAAFCQLVRDEGVASYLEIGAKWGGSLWRVANTMPKGSRIVAVDLPGGTKDWHHTKRSLKGCIAALVAAGYDARVIFGDSTSAEVIAQVKALGPYDLALIDGDHRLPGVDIDWTNYAPECARVAFHDIAWSRPPEWEGGYRIDVPQFWRDISPPFRTREFCFDTTGRDNGIGVLWRG